MASVLHELDRPVDVLPDAGTAGDPTRVASWLVRRWWIAVLAWAAATVWLFLALSR